MPDTRPGLDALTEALDKVRNKIEAASYHRNYRQACIDIFEEVLTPKVWWRDHASRAGVASPATGDNSPLVLGVCPDCGAQGMVEAGATVEHREVGDSRQSEEFRGCPPGECSHCDRDREYAALAAAARSQEDETP